MYLIDRLEKRARELDSRVRRLETLGVEFYDQQAADDRDLLLEAVTRLRDYEALQEKVASWSATIDRLFNRRLGEILG